VRAGQRVADRFEIQSRAAEGGMATVYRAHDLSTGEVVALKVLRTNHAEAEDLARFEREAHTLADLSHPAVVRYVAHGREGEQRFLAVEWVEGQLLADRVAAGRLSIRDTLALGIALAEGLGAAHARGVVHRDVKPGNVILAGGDPARPKLFDFGVAHLARGEITIAGTLIGTAGYMPPEQARGEPVDARADVYALGCTLYRCLTGQHVFRGNDALSVLLKLILERPPRLRDALPEAPPALEALLTRMLAADAADRPADGAAAAAELAQVAASADVARDGSEWPPPRGDAGERALTSRERKVTCVLIARVRSGLDVTALRAAVLPFAGRAEVLAEGAVAVTVGAAGAPIDQAARAARAALAAQPILGGSPVALVAGWGDGRDAIDEAIDRGVPMLAERRDDGGAVRLDEVAAGLLGTRFDVAGDARGLYLRGVRDLAAPERLLLGRPTPCVGRDRELRLLEAMFDDCEREPAARAVVITGEAGVGKSRLRHELIRRLAGRGRAVEIWIGHGDPMSAGSPFGLLGEALRRAAGIAPGEPLATARLKLRARVGRHAPRTEAARLAEFLGELCGVPFDDAESVALRAARRDAQLLGDQMRRAFEDLLAAELSAQPVLVVLEDLHWGDLPSVRLLGAALESLEARPLFVVALGRPDLHAVFPDLWRTRAPAEIKLGPLAARWGEELVQRTLGAGADPATVARVVELSAGNAFYLEELIRAVAAGRGGALPETVVAMVQDVLAALDPELRRALRAASVFGPSFSAAGVAALTGAALPEIQDRLAALVERELLVRRARGARDEDEHAFRHAHVREAAYATLTEADRALGHRLAGAFLEARGEHDAARLAEHFERGGDLARAVAHYRAAAERALEANDLARALALSERGVDCGAEGEDFGALRLTAAEANRWLGRSREALLCAIDAVRALDRGGVAWLTAHGEIGTSSIKLGDGEMLLRAADELESALAGAPAPSSPALAAARVLACTRVAAPLFLLGRGDRAGPLLARAAALEAETPTRDPAVRARVLEARALAALSRGSSGEFLALADGAAAAFAEVGDLRNAAVQRANMGAVHVSLGADAEAERLLAEVLDTADRMGLAQISAAARQGLALAASRTGRHEEARALADASVKGSIAQGNRRVEAGARIVRALVSDDPVEAAREARIAADLAGGATPQRAYAQAVLARALLALGQIDEANDTAAEAARVLEAAGGMDEGEALVRLALAEARLASGDVEGARFAIAEARRRLDERAARVDEGALRRSFLERVPEHRRTLELFAALS
jgi:hypothetical protein